MMTDTQRHIIDFTRYDSLFRTQYKFSVTENTAKWFEQLSSCLPQENNPLSPEKSALVSMLRDQGAYLCGKNAVAVQLRDSYYLMAEHDYDDQGNHLEKRTYSPLCKTLEERKVYHKDGNLSFWYNADLSGSPSVTVRSDCGEPHFKTPLGDILPMPFLPEDVTALYFKEEKNDANRHSLYITWATTLKDKDLPQEIIGRTNKTLADIQHNPARLALDEFKNLARVLSEVEKTFQMARQFEQPALQG